MKNEGLIKIYKYCIIIKNNNRESMAEKRNQQKQFEIIPEHCECGRVMFLRISEEGSLFWSCKGYHKDKKKQLCDITKNWLSCNKCSGHIILKNNSTNQQKFYGCSNYSEVSDFSCNITLASEDMKRMIREFNNNLKNSYNFRSTQANEHDEKIFHNMKNEAEGKHNSIQAVITNETKNEEMKENTSQTIVEAIKEKGKGIIPQLSQGVIITIVSLLLIITTVAIIYKSNLSIDLFGLFKIEVSPRSATSQDIQTRVDPESKVIEIENVSNEPVVIDNLSLATPDANEIVHLSQIEKQNTILDPGETIRLDNHTLSKAIQTKENETEVGPQEDPVNSFWIHTPVIMTNNEIIYFTKQSEKSEEEKSEENNF